MSLDSTIALLKECRIVEDREDGKSFNISEKFYKQYMQKRFEVSPLAALNHTIEDWCKTLSRNEIVSVKGGIVSLLCQTDLDFCREYIIELAMKKQKGIFRLIKTTVDFTLVHHPEA